MARVRSRSSLALLMAFALVASSFFAPAFLAPSRGSQAPEVDARVLAATFAGLTPLAIEQPAGAYDSVVALLQSWLVGGSVMILIYGAAFVAAIANPLTKRREEVKAQVDAERAA
eukprot:TRINITY_DN64976_c0_g1_i1.p2 TRINITY_DN64976_c0_g1~~TRINITY_DN64976_c0_g1_i1.p2  ORF type:complete len:115 (+),score=28.43 TRINITY_DN64976_c0_g1_i1:59-403(+)